MLPTDDRRNRVEPAADVPWTCHSMHMTGCAMGCMNAEFTATLLLYGSSRTQISGPHWMYWRHAAYICLQDKFFAQLKSSPNGFSVIADFFGRGLLDAASISTARSTL